ncbi:MAG: hypothetical protein GY857_07225 [Desulfobacula sp.]|nr:hypothetical protein [Desulfobacula sp.]
MAKQYKIIIVACALAIICNIAVKYYLINKQNKKVIILQKVIAAARSGSYLNSDLLVPPTPDSQKEIDKIFQKIPWELSFTQYAAKLRTLMDSNDLSMEKNLIFRPEKIKNSDLLQYNTNIAVTGDYTKIKKFISDILNIPGLAYFNSINFARTKNNNDGYNQGKVKFQFELSLFFKRGTA